MPLDLVSRFLFPAPPSSYTIDSFQQELIFVPKCLELKDLCPVEQRVPCLFLKYPSARFLVFYLHSNAEDIGKCYSFCHVMREQFQVHVLAVEYPGYGMCPGGPATADSVTENAFAVFRFVREVMRWPIDSIMIFGRSIGTGPAISLAVQYKVAGLILVAPFLSIKELLGDTVGILSHLVEERFPSKDRMHLVRSPSLIIHGRKDTLIPCKHGTALYELCRCRKLLVRPVDMEHNTNLLADVGYLVVPMLQFFALPDYSFEDLLVPAWVYDCHGVANVPSPSPPAPAAEAGRYRSAWCGSDAKEVLGEQAHAQTCHRGYDDLDVMAGQEGLIHGADSLDGFTAAATASMDRVVAKEFLGIALDTVDTASPQRRRNSEPALAFSGCEDGPSTAQDSVPKERRPLQARMRAGSADCAVRSISNV